MYIHVYIYIYIHMYILHFHVCPNVFTPQSALFHTHINTLFSLTTVMQFKL